MFSSNWLPNFMDSLETTSAEASLQARVKVLEERVARLERDSHPPVNLVPAVTSIVHEIIDGKL